MEAPETSPQPPAGAPATSAPRRDVTPATTPRPRMRILPPGLDGRRRAARRLAELARELGRRAPDTAMGRAAVLAAAGLALRCEDLAHRVAAGDEAAGVELERAQFALDAAMRRLAALA